ncbi:MAG: methyltransferase domain-containing protein [Paracoccaceae bacterium]|nr:methyltransferase domain-containing protein [Paracoccaceae bacterium]
MGLTAAELAKRDDFAAQYRRSTQAPIRQVDCAVCGCDYGGTSWADRAEVDGIIRALGLAPGVSLLEIGAGAGWPSLYMARQSGCEVTLTDLPFDGLAIAAKRAVEDHVADRCRLAVADAAHLPFADASFDAINHSDVLCCLVEKQAVLAECRRVLRPGGLMAFSVIYIREGLSKPDHAAAAETAPEFVESERSYPEMLDATGWEIVTRDDLTARFSENCLRKIGVEESLRGDLEPLMGVDFDARQARMRRRIEVLNKGHLKRELFLVRPRP